MRFRPARKLLSAELPQQALDIPGIIGTSVQWGKGSGVVAASGVALIEAAAALTLRPYLVIRKKKKIIITIITIRIETITIIAIITIITIIVIIVIVIRSLGLEDFWLERLPRSLSGISKLAYDQGAPLRRGFHRP